MKEWLCFVNELGNRIAMPDSEVFLLGFNVETESVKIKIFGKRTRQQQIERTKFGNISRPETVFVTNNMLAAWLWVYKGERPDED